jgi:3-methyladenine DNA glycosylase/8-oxoguanine DNA glycosylase
VRSHGWYNLPPFAYERKGAVLRTVVDFGGKAAEVTFRVRGGKLEALSDGVDRARLSAIARRVLSLDLDFAGAQISFAHEPVLSRALASRSPRMLRSPTLFEDAVKMLFTTNCSWGATRGMVVRLVELAGAEGRAFPAPEAVARLSPRTIEKRVRSGYRGAALLLFARRVATAKLDLSRWEDPDRPSSELREEIIRERGFGPYAAEGLLRILGRHDFFALDSWTRQRYRKLHPGPVKSNDRSIARRYARFGPHRGLALWLELTSYWHHETPPDWPPEKADS